MTLMVLHDHHAHCKHNDNILNTFFSARVVNPWNELDKKTVTEATVDKFKRTLSELGYYM